MKKILVICGPTASGKTLLAINCALKWNTEIISADSQLVYKDLNIGTAKPSKSEMQGVIHHMIDVASPKQKYSVFDYSSAAQPVLDNLLKQNKMPIICGGTGFYINSLLFEFGYGGVAANSAARMKYEKYLEANGKQALYNKLKSCDAQTAEKLHINDTKRIIRALEIYELSGRKKSDQNDGLKAKCEYVAVAVNYGREELYDRINLRVDKMFEDGLVKEVEKLLKSGIDENCQCMQAIGYKEVLQCLKNGDNESTMRNIIKQNTRHYAKRQITFFKRLPNIVWLAPSEANADRIAELLNE